MSDNTTPAAPQGVASDELPNCAVCGNSYLAIKTHIYKDKREFIYCDCCGAMADRKTWMLVTPARQPVGTLKNSTLRQRDQRAQQVLAMLKEQGAQWSLSQRDEPGVLTIRMQSDVFVEFVDSIAALATPATEPAAPVPEAWSNVWDEFRPPLSEVVARMHKVRGTSALGQTFVNDLNQLVDAADQMLKALEQRKA